MPRPSWRPVRVALALTLLLAGGCRPGWKYNEQVEGTVKLDGAPVANALVRFVPREQTSPKHNNKGN